MRNTMTAGAMRRRDVAHRNARHQAVQTDTGFRAQTMRHMPLDFNLDYTPQAICCATCHRPIEDVVLEDQAGRPACSETCAAGPHLEPRTDSGEDGDQLRPRAPRLPRDREPRSQLVALTTRERKFLDYLRSIPQPFTLADEQPA